jgi:hypothetical protein
MKTAKELLANYQNELAAFKYTQHDTLLTLLGMWARSENKKEIRIEPGEFRCSVQRFVEVEQTNIVRLSIDVETYRLWLYDEDDNRIGLDDVIDDGAISSIIMLIANHLENQL